MKRKEHPAKLVKITRCSDCPITTCDQRQPCGSIPDTCILDDAPAAMTYTCNTAEHNAT
jgi:hypothetical protein